MTQFIFSGATGLNTGIFITGGVGASGGSGVSKGVTAATEITGANTVIGDLLIFLGFTEAPNSIVVIGS